MGCSPSKGNHLGVLGPMRKGRMLPPAPQESPRDSHFDDAEKRYSTGSTDVDTKERKAAGQTQNAGAKTKVVGSPKNSRRQWTDEERSPRRPQTTAPTRKAAVKKTPVSKERRSQSEESLRSKAEDPTLLELERTQKDLDQRLQRMGKSKPGGNMKTAPPKQNQGTSPAQSPAKNRKHPSLQKNSNSQLIDDKAVLTRRNSKKLEAASVVEDDNLKDKKTSKGPIKATPPPSPPASPRPPSGLYRGRKSVKRLIDTFSQGIEDLEVLKCLGPLIGVRKCGVPVLPGLGNVEAVLSTGITSCRPDSSTFSTSFAKRPRLFIRRSHSDRRPSLNQPPRSPGISVAETCGSEPSLNSQGLDDEPTRYEEQWGSQSNLRTTLRSASHPDLCVVGQALHLD
ncbi:hypothetical protein KUCAC02_025724 [Chaenocephalus aceratus]|uniref:Uncharacterized protein n=1 Tax=Chaenocephalus aceratus TaxID=36190 RepID=A0ACB9VUW6_CHAAC|nr:hypothetical protein KUCAC02_025724 [Chaenocephalus aceratus]